MFGHGARRTTTAGLIRSGEDAGRRAGTSTHNLQPGSCRAHRRGRGGLPRLRRRRIRQAEGGARPGSLVRDGPVLPRLFHDDAGNARGTAEGAADDRRARTAPAHAHATRAVACAGAVGLGCRRYPEGMRGVGSDHHRSSPRLAGHQAASHDRVLYRPQPGDALGARRRPGRMGRAGIRIRLRAGHVRLRARGMR